VLFIVAFHQPFPITKLDTHLWTTLNQSLISRDKLLEQLKSNLAVARNRMKQGADQKRLDVEFQVGDMVFLKLQLYRQYTIFKHAYHKLASRFFGSYPILQRIG